MELFTPLNIINRTPEGCPVQCSRATLLVNELYQAPLKEGRPDSNLHGCAGRMGINLGSRIKLIIIKFFCIDDTK